MSDYWAVMEFNQASRMCEVLHGPFDSAIEAAEQAEDLRAASMAVHRGESYVAARLDDSEVD